MARQKLAPVHARALRRRLSQYVRLRYQTWSQFERTLGLPHATAAGWRHGTATPELPHVIALARRGRLNPSWLLLGLGPELLPAAGRQTPTPRRTRGGKQ